MTNAQPIICEFCLGSPEMQSTINFTSPVVSPNFTSVSAHRLFPQTLLPYQHGIVINFVIVPTF